MLSLQLHKLGKKFNREWIFRDLSYHVQPGQKLLISGGNGSGKSTLLQVLSGFVTPNEGHLNYQLEGRTIADETIRKHISFASPYLQLIEEMTLSELIDHARIFKPFTGNITTKEVMQLLELTDAEHKYIKQFSSGMKQRLKLGLAILSDSSLLLLDEPVSNLDRNAIDWYKNMIRDFAMRRTVIVCSNAISDEHFFCDAEIRVADFKVDVQVKKA